MDTGLSAISPVGTYSAFPISNIIPANFSQLASVGAVDLLAANQITDTNAVSAAQLLALEQIANADSSTAANLAASASTDIIGNAIATSATSGTEFIDLLLAEILLNKTKNKDLELLSNLINTNLAATAYNNIANTINNINAITNDKNNISTVQAIV